MQTEIEAKFLNIDHDQLRAKLTELGATCTQEQRLMKRINYDFADGRLDKERNGWVRVRDEGNKVTMSYKQLNERTMTGTKEESVVVDSFEAADRFLQAIGLVRKAQEESRRESWELDGVEVELDSWPWVKPFIEIEARTAEEVVETARRLGLNPDDATHGSVEVVYTAEYDITEEEARPPKITFDFAPEWVQARKKKA